MAEDAIVDSSGKATGGFLKKKIGPLEVWQIGVGAIGLVLALIVYKRNQASSGSSASTTSNPSVSTVPTTDLSATGAQTSLTGQLADITGQLGTLTQDVQSITANQNPGLSPTTQPAVGSSSGLFGLLGRPANQVSAADAAYWSGYQSTNGLAQSFLAVENTPEAAAYAQSNPSGFVTAQYQELLGRTPTSAEVAQSGFTGQLSGPGGTLQESKAFLASAKNENPSIK